MPKQINAKEAYDAGVKAKRSGFMCVSPYYNQPRADYWWLAGFDGVDFEQAAEKQPEFAARIVSPAKARAMGLPIPNGVDQVQFD
jgi:hypothetical protein